MEEIILDKITCLSKYPITIIMTTFLITLTKNWPNQQIVIFKAIKQRLLPAIQEIALDWAQIVIVKEIKQWIFPACTER